MSPGRNAALLALAPALARAHSGEVLRPHDLPSAWSLEPGIAIPLLASAILYAIGARRARGVSKLQFTCFWSGWTALTLSLISPLHSLGEVLFSAHMAQHEALMLVAAPLLALSRPSTAILWALPMEWRRAAGQWSKTPGAQASWRWITSPFNAWWIHAAVLWIWHLPALFQATLESEWVHAAQHSSFLGSALLFWWSLFYARGRRAYGAGVLYIFTTAIHTSILGALLTFAGTVWYPAYGSRAKEWGLSPLEDQQIGGLIMWVPAGVVYLGAGLALVAAWLAESDIAEPGSGYAR
jgi:putative membrane protein